MTNVVLIYALLLNVTVPFAQTMDELLTASFNNSSSLMLLPITSNTIEDIITENPIDVTEEVDLTKKNNSTPEVSEAVQKLVSISTASPGAGGSGFSINSTDQMVDPFTGDFSYSIPLMDVEGYPITLSYNSNVTMNTEASWVGLGWNLNVGSIEREMRGIPDEFDGTQNIQRVVNQLDEKNNGFKIGKYLGVNVGGPLNDYISLNLGYNQSRLKGIYTNSYLGQGRTFDKSNGGNIGVTFSLYYIGISLGGSIGKTLSYDSKRGINIGFGGGLSGGLSVLGVGGNVSTYSTKNYSSREGITGKTITRGWAVDALGIVGKSHTVTSTVPYGSQTQVPRIEVNAKTKGFTATKDRFVTLSPFTSGKLTQIYSYAKQEIKDGNTVVQPAIGFLHSSKKMTASGNRLPIMDFNRSNDTRYSSQMTNLAFSMQTFDIFYTNAMGMQGTFRAYRTDAGTYEDPIAKDKLTDVTVLDKKGIEQDPALLGIQATYKKEVGAGITNNETFNATLVKDNGTGLLEFTTQLNPVNGFDNAIYFRGVGEKTPVDPSLYNALGGLSAAHGNVWAINDLISLADNTVSNDGSGYTLPTDGKVHLYKPRVATFFRPRTVSELMASPVNYDKYYNNYGAGPNPSISTIARNTGKDGNIISKIEVTSDDGVFYGYGIPNFANTSSQIIFNIGSLSGNPSISVDNQGLVSYTSTDNSVLNNKGFTRYYDRTTVPAYASSFLLTDMHTPDYIDRTGNGPSLDDIGNYYKFNYRKLHEDYHWRFPIAPQKAFYIEGTLGSELDDIATYSAGSKQVWVTHSVESKNYIAEFVLSTIPREDGYGIDDNGNKISTEKTYALQQIELYNRAERQQKGALAKPLQVVEFTYNYELCQNYPSNDNVDPSQRGKLTLKTVRVYTGTSHELSHSYYDFDYGSGNIDNPSFNYGSVDAWGQLKTGNSTYNSRFPYVEQSETTANNNAQAWKLKRITTPNGGMMEVSYESDRYATVQNKRAMKHLKMEGLTNIFDLFSMLYENELDPAKIRMELNTSAALISPYAVICTLIPTKYQSLYGTFQKHNVPNNVVVFKLDKPIPANTSTANQMVKQDYFTDGNKVMEELYMKAHIRVTDGDQSRTELVPVLASISNNITNALNNIYPLDDAPAIGVLPPLSGSTDFTYGYVILRPAKIRKPANEKLKEGDDLLNDDVLTDEAFNPIQKVAFDFFQRSLQDLVFQNTAFQNGNNSVDLLTGARIDISKAMRLLGFGSTLVGGYNSLCVYVPSNIKFGGNARVKSIEFFDNWATISQNTAGAEYNSSYKWNYLYDFNGYTSGVASYESRISNDESPFYGWDSYWDIRVQFPDKFNYTPTPVMEILYPSGVIGYSKVAVQFDNLSNRGYKISEFYTAKDRPTEVSVTNIQRETVDKVWKNSGEVRKIYGMAQGFSLETNDFHGKIKSNSVAKGTIGVNDDPSDILSKTTYEYYGSGEKQKISDEGGAITEAELGMEYDIHADARVIVNRAVSTYAGNEKAWLIPFMAPNGSHNNSNTSISYSAFYSHALIKHANRSAVLKRIKTEFMDSKNQAENLVFDRSSGAVILSSLTDEFDDPIYSLNYPAHWYYPELRNVAMSQSLTVPLTLGSNTNITAPVILALLTPGDQLRFPNGSHAWVTKSYPWPSTPKYFLIDSTGNEFVAPAGTYNVTISASGRSNQINAVMQQIETKTNPLVGTQINFPSTDILSGTAITLRDRLNALCGSNPGGDLSNNNIVGVGIANPYLYGLRGDLVPDNQLTWQSERIQATNNGVRKDGAYTTFVPYYAKGSSGLWYQLTHSSHPSYPTYLGGLANWRKSGETTLYNQYGSPLEGRDPLKINSAQLYGYNPKLELLPVANAANAHKQDIAFDGFEDYNYYSTQSMSNFTTHFSFEGPGHTPITTVTNFRHSGKSSVVLDGLGMVSGTRSISSFQDAETTHKDSTWNKGQVQSCDCINTFSPTPGEYIFGAWIKQTTVGDGAVNITVYNGSTIVGNSSPTASGTAIDGWQRLESSITIPAGATSITISLKNNSDSRKVYFDDFRIHPILADMQTAVYDPVTLMMIASHDGYNYTTFYNYDENNQLVRVRVETSEGIKTISESEMSLYKQQ